MIQEKNLDPALRLRLNPLGGQVQYVAAQSSAAEAFLRSRVKSDNFFTTIQTAVTAVVGGQGDHVLVTPRTMSAGATDPVSYAETITIAAAQSSMSLIGIPRNRTQGGLPQIKKGSGAVALLTVRAPGVTIESLGFNGGSSTGGGILLDDDGSTKSAFGTEIANCHFKDCVGSTATSSDTGGAIQWPAVGNAWQVWIHGNNFYKNVGDVVMLGTSGSVPQDVVIEDNVFSGPAASVDCNINIGNGSGMLNVTIRDNDFPAVDVPALGSGAVLRYIDATGCTGFLTGNRFACLVNPAASEVTFGAAGTAALIPTTMRIADCWGETSSTTERGWVNRV